jgi:DNA topoisomerase I
MFGARLIIGVRWRVRIISGPSFTLPRAPANGKIGGVIRVGNSHYVRENRTFGLTTLRSRHAEISGQMLRLRFKGKSGKIWNVAVKDRRVAKVLSRCQELPGQQLFQYLDEDGSVRAITSRGINAYLKSAAGVTVTAKDFRTWSGTMLCALALSDQRVEKSEARVRRQIAEAVRFVASRLGNTPAICRSAYIHPRVLTAFRNNDLAKQFRSLKSKALQSGLRPEEQVVADLLHDGAENRLSAVRTKKPPKLDGPVRSSVVSPRALETNESWTAIS